MNFSSIIIVALLFLAVAMAVRTLHKKGSPGCCRDCQCGCSLCSKGCRK